MDENTEPVEATPVASPEGIVDPESSDQVAAAIRILGLANEEMKNAREREMAAQVSENRGWLYRNINPVMALLVVMFSFAFFVLILGLNITDPNRKDIAVYLLGGVQTICTMVIGYYFGSSKGSSDKSKVIERMNK